MADKDIDSTQLARGELELTDFPVEIESGPFDAAELAEAVLINLYGSEKQPVPGMLPLERSRVPAVRALGSYLRGATLFEEERLPTAQQAFGHASLVFREGRMHFLSAVAANCEFAAARKQHRIEGAREAEGRFVRAAAAVEQQIEAFGPAPLKKTEKILLGYMITRIPKTPFDERTLSLMQRLSPNDQELATWWLDWNPKNRDLTPREHVIQLQAAMEKRHPTKGSPLRQSGVLLELGNTLRNLTPEQRFDLALPRRHEAVGLACHTNAVRIVKTRLAELKDAPDSPEVREEIEKLRERHAALKEILDPDNIG